MLPKKWHPISYILYFVSWNQTRTEQDLQRTVVLPRGGPKEIPGRPRIRALKWAGHPCELEGPTMSNPCHRAAPWILRVVYSQIGFIVFWLSQHRIRHAGTGRHSSLSKRRTVGSSVRKTRQGAGLTQTLHILRYTYLDLPAVQLIYLFFCKNLAKRRNMLQSWKIQVYPRRPGIP